MSERSLIEVLDGLTEQLKTSTKDVTVSLDKLAAEIKMSRELIVDLISKEVPPLLQQLTDLTTYIKKVFEIQVIPSKREAKR